MLTKVGDGTKLPILLADTLIQGAIAASQRGVLVHDLLNGMSVAVTKAIGVIQGLAKRGSESTLAVAKTAAKHQLDINVVDVINSAGQHGNISLNVTGEDRTTIEKFDHMALETGVLHPEFVSSCPEQTCELDDCLVLLYKQKISSMQIFIPILETVARIGKPLLVIADDVEGEALATLIVNNKRHLRSAALRLTAPQRSYLFEDIAALTGATVINPYLGRRLEGARRDDLGSAKKVIVGLGSTEIIGGRGKPDSLAAYVDGLVRARANAKSDHEREVLKERIAHLAGTTIRIRLGAPTRQELLDQVYRTHSALSAAANAAERGCVPGGGRALLFASRTLNDIHLESPGEREGVLIAKNALMTPFRILVSSTQKDYLPIEEQLLAEKNPDLGYNLRTAHIEDLAAAGILDPLDVVISGLEAAHSVARMFIETGAWQVRTQDPNDPAGIFS
jgi:chaperonin GroEL